MGLFGDFFLKKGNKETKGEIKAPLYDWLKVDMHNHILPGIDDGSPDVATSLEFLRRYHQLGFTTVVATSHIRHPLFPNNRDIIKNAWQQLESAPGRQEIPVKLLHSAEYFIDDHFLDLLMKDELMPFAGGYVLAELSLSSRSYLDMDQIAGQLISKGMHPILAHPERYLYWSKSPETFQKLKQSGWLLQVNLMSLLGYYGKIEQKVSMQLLQDGMVDFVGTDAHKLNHFDVLSSIDNKQLEFLKKTYLLNKILTI
jgi:tyrosine-protein phosphatase YwqE